MEQEDCSSGDAKPAPPSSRQDVTATAAEGGGERPFTGEAFSCGGKKRKAQGEAAFVSPGGSEHKKRRSGTEAAEPVLAGGGSKKVSSDEHKKCSSIEAAEPVSACSEGKKIGADEPVNMLSSGGGKKPLGEGASVSSGSDGGHKKRRGGIGVVESVLAGGGSKKVSSDEHKKGRSIEAAEPVSACSEGKKIGADEPAHQFSVALAPQSAGRGYRAPLVRERTSALIREALLANGSPPRRLLRLRLNYEHEDEDEDEEDEEEGEEEDPVALALHWRGIDREDRYDPYLDCFLIGRPRTEAWNQVWRCSPLRLHDAALVSAVDSVILWGPGLRGQYLDVSHDITRLLENHPGPVLTLRIDSSQFPGPEHLSRWLVILSEKHAREVIFINLTSPVELEVPLHQLRSHDLRYLGIAFVSLQACRLGMAGKVGVGHHHHPWYSLKNLTLTGCMFLGLDLQNTVRHLRGLRFLKVMHCSLTEGCGKDNGLHIQSPALESVEFVSCTASTKLTVCRAPAMRVLRLGVHSCIPIHIDTEMLRELSDVHVPYHQLTIRSSFTRKVNQQPTVSFRCLCTLMATVDMTSIEGAQSLHSLLRATPHLLRLTVLFARDLHSDDAGEDEDLPLLQSVPGVARSLQHLTVEQYVGRSRDVTFVFGVLAAARRLLSVSVVVHPHATMAMSTKDVASFLKKECRCTAASRRCRIRVVGKGSPSSSYF